MPESVTTLQTGYSLARGLLFAVLTPGSLGSTPASTLLCLFIVLPEISVNAKGSTAKIGTNMLNNVHICSYHMFFKHCFRMHSR